MRMILLSSTIFLHVPQPENVKFFRIRGFINMITKSRHSQNLSIIQLGTTGFLVFCLEDIASNFLQDLGRPGGRRCLTWIPDRKQGKF
jgi:hypothetical protein